MPSQKNIDRLQELETKINSATLLIVTDYSGLSVANQTKLRQQIAETNAEFTVAKNTLISRILTNKLKTLPDNLKDTLNGPTAILVGQGDIVTSTKVLAKFITDHQLPAIKIGLLPANQTQTEDKILSIDEITALSQLPSREQLLATLLSQLNAPAQSLASLLSANMRNLVYALSAIKNKKGGETN
jgi:large subunit ribosomal protein L10